jgi:MerR family transcriptional regulator, thiopeptide resistance regulator
MEYSITSLAKKTRVTGRTLRHYDQIGLLKPSVRMASGKRVYSDEEFMRLCEIVFFKKMGIALPKIKEIFRSKDPAQGTAAALAARQKSLTQEIKKLKRHMACIDIVLPQYKNCNMNQQERLAKFCSYQNMIQELERIEMQEIGKEAAKNNKKKIETLSEEKVDELTDESNKLLKEFVKAVEQDLDPRSKEAQALIKWNYDMMVEFHVVTKDMFLKLQNSILDQKEFYAAYHPKLPEFLYQAMGVFIASAFPDPKDI